jgi:hypothetical protein
LFLVSDLYPPLKSLDRGFSSTPQSLVEALADAVGLGMLYLGPGVLDLIHFQQQFAGMLIIPATEHEK